MIGQILFYNRLMEAIKQKSKDDIKRGKATVWGTAAGTVSYSALKNSGHFFADEMAQKGKRHNIKSDKLKQTVDRAYKDMGGKGTPPKVRLGDITGGQYRPYAHAIKLPNKNLPTKKTVDYRGYVDKVFGDKVPSFKRFNEIVNRGTSVRAAGQKTGTARTKLHHIYHEVGHSVSKRGPLSITMQQAGKLATPAGVIAGTKVAFNDKDKHAPLKGAAIGAALSSGTLAGEITPEVRIYKMLKKRGVKPIKAAKWVARRSASNLAHAATKPLAIGVGIGAAGNTYKYLMNKKKPIKESMLTEVTSDLVIEKLLTSKKKLSVAGLRRGLRLIDRITRNTAQRKGKRAAVTSTMDAVQHATRHPKIKKMVDIVNMTEPHFQGLPLHPGRMQ